MWLNGPRVYRCLMCGCHTLVTERHMLEDGGLVVRASAHPVRGTLLVCPVIPTHSTWRIAAKQWQITFNDLKVLESLEALGGLPAVLQLYGVRRGTWALPASRGVADR